MVMLVKLFGVLIVAMVVSFMVKPEIMKKYISFWAKEERIYAGAIASLILGVIFMRGASQCSVSIIVTLVGIWAIIKGIVLFVLGPKKAVAQIDALMKKPEKTLRLLMIVSLVIGILLIYAA